MTADNLLVISRDLLRSCFAPTDIFTKMGCSRKQRLEVAEIRRLHVRRPYSIIFGRGTPRPDRPQNTPTKHHRPRFIAKY